MFQLSSLRTAAFGALGVVALMADALGAEQGVKISESGDTLLITINGEAFSRYHYQDVSRPYLYPVYGPVGARMTRDWPMAENEMDERDHPHHRSLWFAHGDINGVDFWLEGENSGRTVHDEFLEITSGEAVGVIRSRQKLVDKDGKLIATDERTVRIHNTEPHRIMDYEITVHASEGDLVFGDTKEGTMAIRLAPTMRLRGRHGEGHIQNSEGVKDGDTWGKRAKWTDYYGPVDGKTVGVAIFDAPTNPRHPTWWHVRDYGLFAANPFGQHDFESKPEGVGDYRVAAGESVTFRYRFYFHPGTTQEAGVETRYQEFVDGK